MPLRDFKCPNCKLVEEQYYKTDHGVEEELRCYSCGGILLKMPLSAGVNRKTACFPFDTPHVRGDGKTMTITDIGHLRQVERNYGVKLTAFSDNPSNWNDNSRDLPKYRPNAREHDPSR